MKFSRPTFNISKRFCLLLLSSTLTLCCSMAQVPTTNGGTIFYNSDLIQPNLYRTIDVPLECGAISCEENTRTVKLIIDMSLGEGFAVKNGLESFSGSCTLQLEGEKCQTGETYDFTKELKIDQNHPEQVYVYDWTENFDETEVLAIARLGYEAPIGYENEVQVEVRFEREVEYSLAGKTVVTSPVTIPDAVTNSERTFNWNVTPCGTYASYQLQLLRLYNIENGDDNLNSPYLLPSRIKAEIDWNKAMMIETYSPEKSLSLVIGEGTGYYVWRVRGISNTFDGSTNNPNNWGDWSSTGIFPTRCNSRHIQC